MKILKISLLVLFVGAAIVATYLIGYKTGADVVRNGLLANHPTIKNVVQSSDIETDSILTFTLTAQDDSSLFNLLSNNRRSDSFRVSIPYYGRYGVDLTIRHFRFFINDDKDVEIWLPGVTLLYCELKFDQLLINGQQAAAANSPNLHKTMYAYLIPLLGKNRASQKAAKLAVTKALMYYFMPYKFGLRLYIDKEFQDLPLVPGANLTIEEAVKKGLVI
ncbi:MAG TPA: hypothetical protein VK154_18775 [Chitinophagales bacterium]|nr:hypothetical protein [Chitinophagales bacterium]